MTSEQTVSEVPTHQGQLPLSDHQGQADHTQEAGSTVPHGMGQSKSSRRRRRKRKTKIGTEGATPQAGEPGQPIVLPGESIAAQQSAPQSNGQPYQNNGHQQNGQQNSYQQNGGGGKRWKKKFRDRDRQRPNADNIGNLAAGAPSQSQNSYRDGNSHQPGNTTFKRKGGGGKQQQRERGPRSFVGPMDHSYRAVSGNFADGPPSTIETHGGFRSRGGYQGDSQPIDYSQGRPVPIAEDAPTKIYLFIEDLFITAKIQETARKLGVKVAFVKNEKESIASLLSTDGEDRPGLIVFDLNNSAAKPMTLIPKLKTKLKRGTSIVGFLSHLQGDLKAKAVEAGCDVVMPKAAFSQNLPNLLRRYGMEEEDEPNFNQ